MVTNVYLLACCLLYSSLRTVLGVSLYFIQMFYLYICMCAMLVDPLEPEQDLFFFFLNFLQDAQLYQHAQQSKCEYICTV